MKLSQKTKDWFAIAGFFAFIALIIGWAVFYVAGPCKALTWMPAKQTPTRCLEVHVR